MEVTSKAGRKRDTALDGPILDATVAVIAERGYDGMTIDRVAAQSGAGRATIYRRWPSKSDLVLAAVARLSGGDADIDRLPDTGSLRGDLTGLFTPGSDAEQQVRAEAVGALLAVARSEPHLAAAAYDAGIGPWIEVNRLLITRAVDRGEFPPPADLEALASFIPMLCIAQAGRRQPITREFSLGLIDGVLLPALRAGPDPSSPATTSP